MRGLWLNNIHICSLIGNLRKSLHYTEKSPETIRFHIHVSRPPLNKRIGEVPGKRKIWFLTPAAERLSRWETVGECGRGSVTWLSSLMTGREWYTRSRNAGPRGPPSCCAVCAMDFAPDKTGFSRSNGRNNPAGAIPFPVFCKRHAVLTKALRWFRNDLELRGGHVYRNHWVGGGATLKKQAEKYISPVATSDPIR